jgi:Co/Zn/Cd efflux system component
MSWTLPSPSFVGRFELLWAHAAQMTVAAGSIVEAIDVVGHVRMWGESVTRAQVERGTLLLLIAINGVMFIIELAAGWVAESMGLIADSLDMLADAGVYGIALLKLCA